MTFKNLKNIFLFIILANFLLVNLARSAPNSFADLAERLMPSVVNISTTQTVTTDQIPFHFNFLQDHHLKICSKILEHLKKDKLML